MPATFWGLMLGSAETRSSSQRDLFVVHTRRDPCQLTLYQSLSTWCSRVGLAVVSYSDWEWESIRDSPENRFEQIPSNPWAYMPEVNRDQLHRYFCTCEVVLIVDSLSPSSGVSLELTELLRFKREFVPTAITVAASFSPEPSGRLPGGVRAFQPLTSPEDRSIYPFVAVPWLVSRLQRSGRIGLEILDEAKSRCLLLHRYTWFGPYWRDLSIDDVVWRSPVDHWWPQATELHAFMTREATSPLVVAWNVLTNIIESRLRKDNNA
jgi:hypothetical protein